MYLPDHGDNQQIGDRDALFSITEHVALYVGFDRTESARSQRDWEANKVVLSGDLLGNDNTDVVSDERHVFLP